MLLNLAKGIVTEWPGRVFGPVSVSE
ncbi:protein of unknown function (plasmid) [Caballeronia sp. S22]